MGWTRLDNPKPSKSTLGRDNVRVAARAGAKGSRFIVIKVGCGAATKASFTRAEHKCHLLLGGGEDAGNVGIVLDDALGKFVAKRRKDGRYEISVGPAAAEGRFSLTFPPFERAAAIVGDGRGPNNIVFAVSREFLTAGAGK